MSDTKFVRQFLDLSTAHVGEESIPWLDENAVATEYGWWLYVHDCDSDELKIIWPDCPDEIVPLCGLARKLGCDYIMLDGDAMEMDELPTWEW